MSIWYNVYVESPEKIRLGDLPDAGVALGLDETLTEENGTAWYISTNECHAATEGSSKYYLEELHAWALEFTGRFAGTEIHVYEKWDVDGGQKRTVYSAGAEVPSKKRVDRLVHPDLDEKLVFVREALEQRRENEYPAILACLLELLS